MQFPDECEATARILPGRTTLGASITNDPIFQTLNPKLPSYRNSI